MSHLIVMMRDKSVIACIIIISAVLHTNMVCAKTLTSMSTLSVCFTSISFSKKLAIFSTCHLLSESIAVSNKK